MKKMHHTAHSHSNKKKKRLFPPKAKKKKSETMHHHKLGQFFLLGRGDWAGEKAMDVETSGEAKASHCEQQVEGWENNTARHQIQQYFPLP